MDSLSDLESALEDAESDLAEANESGDLEERLDLAHRVADLQARVARLKNAASLEG
jgi:hypothetical protein